MKVKVGFIGTGGIANTHIQRLAKIEDVKLTSFCDVVKEKAENSAKKYGANSYTNYEEMLNKEKLDAVYICLPPFAHTNQEILACEKKINIFVEKPIALSEEKASQINEAVKKSGVISSVGYMYRYSDIVNKAKKETNNKRIALLLGYYLCPMPGVSWWRVKNESGGQIVEQTTHIFDTARYLAGDVDKVYARGFKGLMKEVENYSVDDASSVILQFKNGAIGNISSTCILSKNWNSGMEVIIKGTRIQLLLSQNILRITNEKEEEIKTKVDPYLIEDEVFIEAVKSGDPRKIKSPYSDALKTLRVTLAANASIEKGEIINLD